MPFDYMPLLRAVAEAGRPASARLDAPGPLPAQVVVLPAAFNPPTLAHADLMHAASAVTGAHPAALLTTANVDKAPHGASFEQRVQMLLAASESGPPFAVMVTNQARFIDQAAALTATFTATDFDFALGYDTLVRLFDPRYYGEGEMHRSLTTFFDAHRVVASPRAEAAPGDVDGFMVQWPEFAHRVVVVEISPAHAMRSSSNAREQVGRGEDPGDLAPAVADYIRRAGLYRP